jgi:hypothetical protein
MVADAVAIAARQRPKSPGSCKEITLLSFCANDPTLSLVFNELKGGDPMSSGFNRSVAPADRPFGKQSS